MQFLVVYNFKKIKDGAESVNTPTLQSLEEQFILEKFQILIQQAYENGVKDGQTRFSYPPVLTNAHLAEILQVQPPTVQKIVTEPSFPKLTKIRARYPRDAVFSWIERNTAVLVKYTA
ncbi:hypothetical protein [Viridibacillus arvi]|uniref:hypothetical protein n=1 Tax=Viridibacillus arvi TaxID=263475 RepID=UPI003CFCA066